MRTFLICFSLCGVFSGLARADEQQQQPSPEARTADQANDPAASDPNCRWHNGHWWYWQNDQWLLWDGSRWGTREAFAQRQAARRSFSYMQEPAAAVMSDGYVPTQAGLPPTGSGMRRGFGTPGTVEYQKVLPSFGVRSAGSKVLGHY